nr:MBL fold metallo-hydrolase [Clostridia bacterium]
MAKLHIFGSCSGTEPMPKRHHCSFAIEAKDGGLYWFDAGENCSYTAHLMGLDVLKIRKIFISHCHIDHVGGLPGLFGVIRKMTGRLSRLPDIGGVEVIIPRKEVFDAAVALLNEGNSNYKGYPMTCTETHDGVIFEDENLTVEALHNNHLPHKEGDRWYSYSFKITLHEGGCDRVIIFSGDIRHPTDIETFLKPSDGKKVELFLMESGHHNPPEVAKWLIDNDCDIGRLCFIHHGRHILEHYDDTLAALNEVYLPREFIISDDAMTLDV